jgi:flagellar biogenesis protein FliO
MNFKKLFYVLTLALCGLSPLSLSAAPLPTEAAPTTKETAPQVKPPVETPLPPQAEPDAVLDQPAVSYESAFFKMLLTLGGLILVVFLTIWLLRRLGQGKFGGAGSSRTIHILEKRPLSAKSMLYLVQVGSKQVLISESQFEVRRIASVEEIGEDA